MTATSVLIAIATLAACGGGKSSTSSSQSSSTFASAAASGEFCKTIVANKADQIGADPNAAKYALAIMQGLTPPDEIKDDWGDFLAALKDLSETDVNDQGKLARIAAAHGKSLSTVPAFISTSCLNLGPSQLSSLSSSLTPPNGN